MARGITIKEWINNFVSGEYDAADVSTQIDAGWFDWFCSDKTLHKRTVKLGKKLMQIRQSSLIDINESYVFFKNNCPMCGGTYDSFSICDIESGNVQYWVGMPNVNANNKYEVFGPANEFEAPLAAGSWKDIKAFFLAA